MELEKVSAICKALSDPNRLKIIALLTDGEKCACRLLEEFNITQPTLSHHMKILSNCDLVTVRKDGKWSHYSLNCEVLTAYREYINTLVCNNKERKCKCC